MKLELSVAEENVNRHKIKQTRFKEFIVKLLKCNASKMLPEMFKMLQLLVKL